MLPIPKHGPHAHREAALMHARPNRHTAPHPRSTPRGQPRHRSATERRNNNALALCGRNAFVVRVVGAVLPHHRNRAPLAAWLAERQLSPTTRALPPTRTMGRRARNRTPAGAAKQCGEEGGGTLRRQESARDHDAWRTMGPCFIKRACYPACQTYGAGYIMPANVQDMHTARSSHHGGSFGIANRDGRSRGKMQSLPSQRHPVRPHICHQVRALHRVVANRGVF